MLACKLDSSIQGTLLAGRAGSLASQASQPANVTMFSCYYSLLESPFPYKSCAFQHEGRIEGGVRELQLFRNYHIEVNDDNYSRRPLTRINECQKLKKNECKKFKLWAIHF